MSKQKAPLYNAQSHLLHNTPNTPTSHIFYETIPNEYIVHFKRKHPLDKLFHFKSDQGQMNDTEITKTLIHNEEFLSRTQLHTSVLDENFKMMFGKMTDEELDMIRSLDSVEYVQSNLRYKLNHETYETKAQLEQETQSQNNEQGYDRNNEHIDFLKESLQFSNRTALSQGLDRISQLKLPLDGRYEYDIQAGNEIDVFVLDTGVDCNHPLQKPDQAQFYTDCTQTQSKGCNRSYDVGDLNGHGTHVAGIIASKDYGVAKDARIKSIRILNSKGVGSSINILLALEEVLKYAVDTGSLNYAQEVALHEKEFSFTLDKIIASILSKIVINLSVGSSLDIAVDRKIDSVWKAGIVVVSAAGNDARDANLTSPSSASDVIVVGASNLIDSAVSYSNYGSILDLYAPGYQIQSLNAHYNNNEYNKMAVQMSGTSMACPHVSGAAALILSKQTFYKENIKSNFNFTFMKPDQVLKLLIENSINTIRHNQPNTTHRLLYIGNLSLWLYSKNQSSLTSSFTSNIKTINNQNQTWLSNSYYRFFALILELILLSTLLIFSLLYCFIGKTQRQRFYMHLNSTIYSRICYQQQSRNQSQINNNNNNNRDTVSNNSVNINIQESETL